MNKPTIFLLLVLAFFSCQKKVERIDIANVLRGNTFNITSIGEKDTLTIDFKDSTYTVFEYSDRNLPWRIASFENNNLLVFDRRVIAIKQIDNNTLKGLLISEKDYEITLEKRKPKWDEELIFGTWVEEGYFKTDPINIPPPPPPANVDEKDFEFPPYYKITKDSIYSSFYYYRSKSKIDISNSLEFILLDLNSRFDNVETNWRIKSLNDSIMILDRTIKYPHDNSYHIETETDLKLIKKR